MNNGTHIIISYQGQVLETFSFQPDLKGMVRMGKNAAETATRPMSDLVKSWWLEVADRQIEYYHAISGVTE